MTFVSLVTSKSRTERARRRIKVGTMGLGFLEGLLSDLL